MKIAAFEHAEKTIVTQLSPRTGKAYFNLGIKQARTKNVFTEIGPERYEKREKSVAEELPKERAAPYENGHLKSQQLYMQQAGEFKVLTRAEEVSLFKSLEEGDESARETIIKHNLRLVVSNAHRHGNPSIDLMDLIQEGNIGLMVAVDKFDYRRGYKFSTYATYWIAQAILRHISSKGRTIKVPVTVKDTIKKYKAFVDEYIANNGDAPSIETVAAALEVNPDNLRKVVRNYEWTDSYSLDYSMPYGDGDNASLADFIPDPEPLPEETSITNDIKEKINEILFELNEKEEMVIRLRYGLDDGKERTLEDIGKIFGVTREWICQIERSAINKLRKGESADELREIMFSPTS